MKRLWGIFQGMVEFLMSRFIGKIHKIIKTIVSFVPRNMVDTFRGFKIPSKVFFHYKTVFENIFFISAERVIRLIDMDITILIYAFPFKIVAIFSRELRKLFTFIPSLHNSFSVFIPRSEVLMKSLRAAFQRTKFCCFNSVGPNRKLFTTSFANLSNFVHILIIALFFSLSISVAYAGNQWQEGTGENTLLGVTEASDIDKDSFENIVDPLDRLLDDYREGCRISYASASTITVGAGEIVLENVAGTIKLFQENTSATTVGWADIDAGAEANSTTYYLYAFQETVTTTTFSVTISTNSSAPTGKTYYKRIGSFYNNSSGNITNDNRITNDNEPFMLMLGDWVAKSFNTNYQASTDGFVTVYLGGGSIDPDLKIYTDSSSSPSTVRVRAEGEQVADYSTGTCPVKKNDYYNVYGSTMTGTEAVYWIPQE